MLAHHRAASENVLASNYIPPSPSSPSPLLSFASLQAAPASPPADSAHSSATPSYKSRRPSISSAMTWLKDAHGIKHSKGPSPVVISEPTLVGNENFRRFGELGTGAVIVGSVADALNPDGRVSSIAQSSSGTGTANHRGGAHNPSPSLPANIVPYNETGPYPKYQPPRHQRTGSRAANIRESELPPPPASPFPHYEQLALPRRSSERPRDGLISRGSSEGRRSGETTGTGTGSARTSSTGRRTDLPAARPPPSSALPTPPNASPLRTSPRLRNLDVSPSRSTPSTSSQMFPTPVSLPYPDPQFPIRKRSPAPPPLPVDMLLSATPQPAFEALLMGPLPSQLNTYEMAKVVVQLETSTAIMKTTLRTLLSRPSHLAAYLIGLHTSGPEAASEASPSTLTLQDQGQRSLSKTAASTSAGDDDECASVYSERSEFYDSDFDGGKDLGGLSNLLQDSMRPHKQKRRHHKQDLKQKQASKHLTPSIHLFLDRPSSPYPHILMYLRTPSLAVTGGTSSGMLPAALRVFSPRSCTRARLEAIIELRDEATYLGLSNLADLCIAELTSATTMVSLSPSTPEMESQSLHSTHTLIEPDERGTVLSIAGDLAPGPVAKGFHIFSSAKEASSADVLILPPEIDLRPESEREREKGAERAQAALRSRRQNASRDNDETEKETQSRPTLQPQRIQSQFRFPGSVSRTNSQSDSASSMFSRQTKSVSPTRGRRAGPPLAVKPPSGDYF